MNRFARSLSALLSLSLFLAAPGLAPYQAAAQTLGAARVIVPVGPLGASGAAINGLGGASTALPSSAFTTSLTPSLAPSAVAPSLAPTAFAAAASPSAVPVAAAPTALAPAAAKTFSPAAAAPALGALRSGTASVAKAAEAASADAPRVALDGLFEGSLSRPSALEVAGRLSTPSDSPRLRPSTAREPARGPRWVSSLRGPTDAAPATSVKRTLSVGVLAAVGPLVFTIIAITAAQLLGHVLNPNYEGPSGADGATVVKAVAVFVGAAVMAPISEEVIFRGGLQGMLAKLSSKIRLGSFLLPAIITSLIFVALHETSDPVLFGTRFVHAMVLSYAFHKEGILAAMAAHGIFNGLLAIGLVTTAVGMPWLSLIAVPASLYFAIKAFKTLRAQKGDIASGALVPKPMSGSLSIIFAAILLAGYLFLMPNIFWAIGAVGLLVNAIVQLKKK